MFPRVRGVRHVRDYELEMTFSDGTVAKLDFRRRVVARGGVFAPLENIDFFKQVSVDREAGTLVWPNGVDLCPDVLYAEATGRSINELGTKAEVV
jgi:hypothetical protein